MTKAEVRRFARIYYQEFKRDYPDVYADDGAWAAWTRLLVGAEEAWPAMPELPRSVKTKALRKLAERGLVVVTGHTYDLKGWITERTKRQESARNAAGQRWHSDSNAEASANAMPRQRQSTNQKGEQGVRPLADGPRLVVPVDPSGRAS